MSDLIDRKKLLADFDIGENAMIPNRSVHEVIERQPKIDPNRAMILRDFLNIIHYGYDGVPPQELYFFIGDKCVAKIYEPCAALDKLENLEITCVRAYDTWAYEVWLLTDQVTVSDEVME